METLKKLFLNNRMKSLYWRCGMMLGAAWIDVVAEALTTFNLPTEVVVLLGLILGEVSKYINKKLQDETIK